MPKRERFALRKGLHIRQLQRALARESRAAYADCADSSSEASQSSNDEGLERCAFPGPGAECIPEGRTPQDQWEIADRCSLVPGPRPIPNEASSAGWQDARGSCAFERASGWVAGLGAITPERMGVLKDIQQHLLLTGRDKVSAKFAAHELPVPREVTTRCRLRAARYADPNPYPIANGGGTGGASRSQILRIFP